MRLPQTAVEAIEMEIESQRQSIAELEQVLSMAGVGAVPAKGAPPAKKGEKRVMTPEQRLALSKKIKAAHRKKKKLALKAAEAAAAVATPAGEEEFEADAVTGKVGEGHAPSKGLSLAPGAAIKGA